jgi:uncharacterized protein (TIGR03382 family)
LALAWGALAALLCASRAVDSPRYPDPCSTQVLPGPLQVCRFIVEANAWDGFDRRWDGAIVGPALEDAFARGLAGDPSSVRVCELDEVMLPPDRAAAPVDVSAGPVSCFRLELLCLGKTDGASTFFEDPAGAYDDSTAAGSPGCSAATNGREGSPAGLVAIAFAIGWLARRRARS